MNIVVCFKLTPDTEELECKPDGSVSFEKAEWHIGEYDLMALEVAVTLAEKTGGKVTALSAGSHQLLNPMVRKNILSRGPAELYLVLDKTIETADTNLTARILAAAIQKIGGYDLIICGEGSADLNFQQVGLQLGELLGIPTINAISNIDMAGDKLVAERSLEEEIEILHIPLPAALAVTSNIAQPRVPGLREILQAGRKKVVEWSAQDIGLSEELRTRVNIVKNASSQKIKKQDVMFPILMMLDMLRSGKTATRKHILISGRTEEAIHTLVDYLEAEGVL